MAKASAETPLMKQHREIKSRYPDAVLLFRVGDFYETFGDDAHTAAKVLGITLTKRANGGASDTALAGFPHHSLDTYLHKLVKAGHRVAVCDQLEDPKLAKGIVKRGVTEMVTPGVAVGDKLLEHKSNNFLAALHLTDTVNGMAFLDISTGEFFAAAGDAAYVDKLLQSFQPSEIVLAKGCQKKFRETYDNKTYLFGLDDWIFSEQYAYDLLLQQFSTQSLKGFGMQDLRPGIIAAGAALHYLKDTEHPNLQHLSAIQRLVADDFLWMDRFTVRNLELFSGGDDGARNLLQAMDSTVSPMGARLLKRWLAFPLFDLHAIRARQDAVEAMIGDRPLAGDLQRNLRAMGDLERLISKVPLRKASPREVVQLARGLQHLEEIQAICAGALNKQLQDFSSAIQPCTELQSKITTVLREDAPVAVSKGNLIAAGAHAELDELRGISSNAKDYLLRIQQEEISATGISSLKVAFNNVFGYYLEVTNTHKDKVPPHWHRKQTLANAERYTTQALKELEEKILGAEEKIAVLELEIFAQLLSDIAPFIACIQQNAHIAAQLDCLLCFAENAIRHKYNRPAVTQDLSLQIIAGRHPVIEQRLPPGEAYVSNDTFLDKDTQQIIILTGPNMSGKSALLRQTALIVLMAHMGSFVPAESAVIGLTDKIFTRVGASDNLSAGESTFMVEMHETASIVNNLTERSLVLLDEIGRGTATYDGISIAWSLAEHLHEHPACPKTLFATHYHELNDLEKELPRVHNYHITYQETASKVLFLRKLAPGGSRHSFGIHVARMAGMPPKMLARAQEILEHLESRTHSAGEESQSPVNAPRHRDATIQLNMFGGQSEEMVRMRRLLDETDINRLTPVEALMKLNELKVLADS